MSYAGYDDIQGLLGQFQPSQEDRDAARKAAILQFGLGLLGTHKGEELQRVGLSGLNASGGYQATLQNAMKERQGNLTQAAQLSDLLRKSKFANELDPGSRPQIGSPMSGGGASYTPPGLSADQANAMRGARGVIDPAVQSAMDKTDAYGGSSSPAPSGPQGGGIYQQLIALGVPPIAIKTAAMSNDPPGAIAALVKEYSTPVFGQGKIPMVRTADGFRAAPAAGYNDALAAQTGAETGAQEAAKAPYSLQNLNLPGGGTQQVFGDQLQKILRGNNGMPATAGPAGLAGQAPTPGQVAEQRTRGEKLGAVPDEIASSADNAVTQAARVGEMRKLADLMPFGATAPARVDTAKYLLDIPKVGPALANKIVDNASVAIPAAQAFGKMASQIVIEQSKQLGTREAASVIQMVANSNPNLSWTRDAAHTAMDYIEGSNKWATERQQASQHWLAGHNGSSDGFQAAWNKEHPLSSYIPPLDRLESAFKTGTVADKSAPQLTQAAQSNSTAKTLVQQVLKSGDPAKIQRLKELGYLQ